MKTINLTKPMALAAMFVSLSAFAQNLNGDITTQVTLSRDYAQTMLNTMKNTSDQFNESSDYSKLGPALKKTMEIALAGFRDAMNRLAIGSFVNSVNAYNEIARDTQMDAATKDQELTIRASILNQQVNVVATIYSAEIAKLYSIVPALSIKTVDGRTLHFADRSSIRVEFMGSNEYGLSPKVP